jgi:hypothetical protein
MPRHLLDERARQRRRDVREVRALGDHPGEPLVRRQPGHERHLAAEIEVRQHHAPDPGDERQRAGERAPAARPQVEVHRHVPDDRVHRPLGVHHALRPAGGPAGVPDDAQVVGASRDHRRLVRRRRQQPRPFEVRSPSALAQRNHHVSGVEVGDLRRHIAGVDERPRVGVVDDGPDLVADEPVVDVHRDVAAEQAADVRLDRLDPVADHERDVVAGLESLAGERVREACAVAQDLAMGTLRAVRPQRDAVTAPGERTGEERTDRHFAPTSMSPPSGWNFFSAAFHTMVWNALMPMSSVGELIHLMPLMNIGVA